MKIISLKVKGFTLLELLFVIVIISVIATAGMAVVKQRAQEAKIEKCVAQIQQMMQAAMAYYVDNTCWPNGTKCPSTAPDFVSQYMPFAEKDPQDPTGKTYLNPWGADYSYGPVHVGTAENKFQVSTTAPNSAIALRIKGMLPNATIDTTTNTKVLAEVIVPRSGEKNIYVAKVGHLITEAGGSDTKSFTISGFNCAKGYISAIYFNTESFSSITPSGSGTHYPLILIKNPDHLLADGGGCPQATGDCSNYVVTIDLSSTGRQIWPYASRGGSFWGSIITTLEPRSNIYHKIPTDPTSPDIASRYFYNYTANYAIYCCIAHYDSRQGKMVSDYCKDYVAGQP